MTDKPLRLALIGVPDHVMRWVTAVAEIIFARHGDYTLTYLDQDEATLRFLEAPPEGHQIVVSHFPRDELCRFLAEWQVPTLVLIDAPLRCVAQLVKAGYPNALDAARGVSLSLALIAGSGCITTRIVGYPEHLQRMKASIFVEQLANKLLGISISAADPAFALLVPDVSVSVVEAADGYFRLSDAPAMPAIDEKSATAIDLACSPLVDFIRGKRDIEVVWPIEFFLDATTLQQASPHGVELIGPARCLYFGPYLHLPCGGWAGDVEIGLSADIIDTYLRAEVSNVRVLADFMARGRRAGLFALPIDFVVEDARFGHEVRLFIDRGEIGGRLGLVQVRLRRFEHEVSTGGGRDRHAPDTGASRPGQIDRTTV